MGLFTGKKSIIIATGLAMLAVTTSALSTLAWFQINSQPLENQLVTASPDLNIHNDEVTGYKIETPIGANGFRDYSVENVSSLAGGTRDVTNVDKEGEDTDFDIPSEGVGYYLIRQNESGTFKYQYNGNSYYHKFENEYTTSTIVSIDSLALVVGKYRVRYYSFDGQTIHRQIKIGSTTGAGTSYTSIDADTGDINVPTAGTYRIWLDYTSDTFSYNNDTVSLTGARIGFEEKTITSEGVTVRSLPENNKANGVEKKSRKNTISSGSTYRLVGQNVTLSSGTVTWDNSSSAAFSEHDTLNYYYLNGVTLTTSSEFQVVTSGNWDVPFNGGIGGLYANVNNHNGLVYKSGNNYKVYTAGTYNFYLSKADNYLYVDYADNELYYTGSHTQAYTFSNETIGSGPGSRMIPYTANSTTYHKIGVPTGGSKIIFNTGNWSSQTGNIDYSENTPFYNDSGAIDTSTLLSFKSSANSWTDEYFTYDPSSRTFSYTTGILPAGESPTQFGFQAHTFRNDYSGKNNTMAALTNTTQSGNNYVVSEEGSYTFTISADALATYDNFSYGITATFTPAYTVEIVSNNDSYGTVSSSSITVLSGATVSTSSNTLTITDSIGSNVVTATATTATSTYSYAFSSWTNASETITANRTITANFTRTPQSYTITYKDQGNVAFSGSHVDSPSAHPTSHTYGTATTLNSATKTGYRFDGWFITSACTGDVMTSLGATDYTDGITLYAKWTQLIVITLDKNSAYHTVNSDTDATNYTIYSDGAGNYYYGTNAQYGLSSALMTTTSNGVDPLYRRHGWNNGSRFYFEGWYSTLSSDNKNPLTKDPLPFVNSEGYITNYALDSSTDSGIDYLNALSNGTYAVTLYATWTYKYYRVGLYNDNNDGNTSTTSHYIYESKNWSLFYTDVEPSNKASPNTDGDGGSSPYTNDYRLVGAIGNKYSEFTVPTLAGYTFVGYYWTSDYQDGTMFIDADGKLTSQALEYHANGNYRYTYSNPNYYMFYYDSNTTSGRLGLTSLYAKWERIYTITLNNDGGSANTTIYENYNVGYYSDRSCSGNYAITSVTRPTKSGYAFGGYYTGQSGSGTLKIPASGVLPSSTTFSGDNTTITVYAYWIPLWTITLNNHDATEVGSTAIYETYGVGYYLGSDGYTDQMNDNSLGINVPSKRGYTFQGYYTSTDGNGDQILTSSGYLASLLSTTKFSSNVTIHAYWTVDIYAITLTVTKIDNSNTVTQGTATYYQKYGIGIYSSLSDAQNERNAITSITRPTQIHDSESIIDPDYGTSFRGYWTGSSGSGTRAINDDGTFVSGVNTLFAENTTLYTNWVKLHYVTLNYNNADSGTGGASTGRIWHAQSGDGGEFYVDQIGQQQMTEAAGDGAHVTPVSLTGYYFKGYNGWLITDSNYYIDENGYLTSYCVEHNSALDRGNISGNAQIDAYWEQKVYQITLSKTPGAGGTNYIYLKYYNGSEGSSSEGGYYNTATYDNVNNKWIVDSNDKMTTSANGITIPTRTGYSFGGYWTSSNGQGTNIINTTETSTAYISSNSLSTTLFNDNTTNTIYVYWVADTFTIALNGNGNTGGSTANVVATYDQGVTLTTNGYTKTNYIFAGWSASSSATDPTYTDSDELTSTEVNALYPGTNGGTKNLYAVWNYLIYLYDVDGAWTSNQSTVTAGLWGSGSESVVRKTYSNGLYTFSIPTKYTNVYFHNGSSGGSNQTIDITLSSSNAGQYYAMYKNENTSGQNESKNTGAWYDSASYINSYYTYYFYDAKGTWGSVYMYMWNASTNMRVTSRASVDRQDFDGSSDNPTARALYTFRVPKYMTGYVFFTGDSGISTVFNSMTGKTTDISVSSGTYDGYHYVVESKANTVTATAYQYLLSENTKTYYIYYPSNTLNIATPKAYAWVSSGDTPLTNYYLYDNGWITKSTTVLNAVPTGHASFVPYTQIYKIVLSESYNNIIFGSDINHKTVDLGGHNLTSYDGMFFTITNNSTANACTGIWIDYFVKLVGSYTINGTASEYEQSEFAVEYQENGEVFTPGSHSGTAVYKVDNTNGILYSFTRSDNKWYTDTNCSVEYSEDALEADTILYAKFNADVTNNSSTHKTFYVDIRNATTTNTGYHWNTNGDGVSYRSYTASMSVSGKQVSENLFRFTVPVPGSGTNVAQLYDSITTYGGGKNNDYSDDITLSNLTAIVSGRTIIYVGTALGEYDQTEATHHSITFCNVSTSVSDRGTAKIQYWDGDSWETLINMNPGDGTYNKFVYEHGVLVAVNTPLRLVHTATNSTVTYYGYTQFTPNSLFYISASSHYVNESDAGTGGAADRGYSILTTGYTGNVRFNFYMTGSDAFSAVMVPLKGNGYYIMESNQTSWNDARFAYGMWAHEQGYNTNTYDAQFKAVINFNRGDTFKIRMSDKYVDNVNDNYKIYYDFTNSSVISTSGTDITVDGNRGTGNLYINTSGKYVFYLKHMVDTSSYDYELWARLVDMSNPEDPDYDVELASNGHPSAADGWDVTIPYVVGETDYSTGIAVPRTSNTGFVNGKKMAMSSKVSASYNGYYAKAGSMIFIRSYIDAVDTLYTLGNTTLVVGEDADHSVTLNNSTGIITFGSKTTGYYNIYVQNGRISMEVMSDNVFFRLNPLDSSNLTNQESIFDQKTAIVLEVPFNCVGNSYESSIELTLNACPSYIGVLFYVSETKLADPYNMLHDHATANNKLYHNIANTTTPTNLNTLYTSIPAGDTDTHYVYILIDYLYIANYTSETYPKTANLLNPIEFRLSSVQN